MLIQAWKLTYLYSTVIWPSFSKY